MQVGFTKEGKILALDLDVYNNGGNSLDLSGSVLERALFHSDNVYRIKDMRVRGRVCFTNLSSNTAFRGFGGPQGMLIVENWIERIASEVGRRPEEIRVSLSTISLHERFHHSCGYVDLVKCFCFCVGAQFPGGRARAALRADTRSFSASSCMGGVEEVV